MIHLQTTNFFFTHKLNVPECVQLTCIWHHGTKLYKYGCRTLQQHNSSTWKKYDKWHALHVTHTHTHLTALFPGLPTVPRWAGTRKVEPIYILLEQETVSGSGISWAICKSAPCSRQITMPAPCHSVFYKPDALPAVQPTASKHWRQACNTLQNHKKKLHKHNTCINFSMSA